MTNIATSIELTERLDFVVVEGDDPLVQFTLRNKDRDAGTSTPENLSNCVVELILKDTVRQSDDDDDVVKYSSAGVSPAILITNAAGGVCTVQFAAGDLAGPSDKRYRLRRQKSEHWLTYAHGTIRKANV